jgi:hypothetical protein
MHAKYPILRHELRRETLAPDHKHQQIFFTHPEAVNEPGVPATGRSGVLA